MKDTSFSSRSPGQTLIFALAIAVMFWSGLRDVSAGGVATPWEDVVRQARGQTVDWYAWGGSQPFNAFMRWAGDEVEKEFAVRVNHVRLSETAEAVRKVLAEKQSGRLSGGAVDLIWINGENFRTMKDNGLLFGPFVDDLPNSVWIDPDKSQAVSFDFTVPTEGYEAPWGASQLTFLFDPSRTLAPPRSAAEFMRYAEAHPGRLTYPAPPDFVGVTVLKQFLYELVDDPQRLFHPVDEAHFEETTEVLWNYLDRLHPLLWRSGKNFARNSSDMETMLGNNQIDVSVSFNVHAHRLGIKNGTLPPGTQRYFWTKGTIGNINFLAIPFNAKSREGALVLTNFLLSPRAQARREDPDHWGDGSVLNITALPDAQQRLFGERQGTNARVLPEPHPSWARLLENTWQQRYG